MSIISKRAAEIRNRSEAEKQQRACEEKANFDNAVTVLLPAMESAIADFLEYVSDERFEEIMAEHARDKNASTVIEVPLEVAVNAKLVSIVPEKDRLPSRVLDTESWYHKTGFVTLDRTAALRTVCEKLDCIYVHDSVSFAANRVPGDGDDVFVVRVKFNPQR